MNNNFFIVVVLLGCIASLACASKYPVPREFCDQQDITKEPRLEARKLDGLWYTQYLLTTSASPPLAILFWQFQGRILWSNDWNLKTRKCTYRKFEEMQQQSAQFGPFPPCYASRSLLPVESDTPFDPFLYLLLNKRVAILYRCPGNFRRNKSCSVTPFVRVLTRTRKISSNDMRLVERKLRSFGLSLRSLPRVDISVNACPIPEQRYQRHSRKTYGYPKW